MINMEKFKTLRLFRLFGRWSLDDALKELGEYEPDPDDGIKTVAEVTSLFTGETVGLEEPVGVDLIQVNSDLVAERQVREWMKDNGYEPMRLKHTIAIALQHPEEQEALNSIWTLGSVRNGYMFVLDSQHTYGQLAYIRRVFSVTRRGHFFGRGCLFGAIKTSVK